MSLDIQPLLTALAKLREKSDLTREESQRAIGSLMSGACGEEAIAEFLLLLRDKGETVAEVAGAAAAMREAMTPIRSRRERLIDTCGTGGDGSATFNISTAAALVAAAAGASVAKHGNRSVSSRSGSADVLTELGVNIDANLAQVERCLEELGICFCFAPLLHPSMRHVAAVRKKLGVPTIFNLLGPLCNPAAAPRQLIGVGPPARHRLIAEALALLGVERAAVIRGRDGLDEITLADATDVFLIEGPGVDAQNKPQVSRDAPAERGAAHDVALTNLAWSPADFDIPPASLAALQVASPAESAATIRGVLTGERGPARDIVVINAAAALWLTETASDFKRAAALAADAIDDGAARGLLARLARLSHQ